MLLNDNVFSAKLDFDCKRHLCVTNDTWQTELDSLQANMNEQLHDLAHLVLLTQYWGVAAMLLSAPRDRPPSDQTVYV